MKQIKNSLKLMLGLMLLSVFAGRVQAAPFDQQSSTRMTPHHESALVMAQMALTKAQLPEVKRLARGIIADQKKKLRRCKRGASTYPTPQPR
jgi:uncharacterized protein (DUF305 family)